MKRFWIVWLFLMPLSLFLSGGNEGSTLVEQDTLAIGVFAPTRGPRAAEGAEIIQGARLALEQANRAGGVEGRPLRLVIASADSNWDTASRELVRLIYREKAKGIVGGLEARSAHLAAQIITRARGEAVFITPWASEMSYSQVPIPWLFRTVSDDRRQSTVLAEEIFQKRYWSRVAVWVGSDFNDMTAAETFLRRAPSDKVTTFQSKEAGQDSQLVQKLQDGKFQALLIFAQPGDAVPFVRRIPPKVLSRVALYAPMSLAVPSFLSQVGEAANHFVVVTPALNEESPKTLQFIHDYQERYQTQPGLLAAHAFDSLNMLVAALRRWNPEQEEGLSSMLATISLEGATGTVHFDRGRARDGLPRLTRVQDGVLGMLATAPRERIH